MRKTALPGSPIIHEIPTWKSLGDRGEAWVFRSPEPNGEAVPAVFGYLPAFFKCVERAPSPAAVSTQPTATAKETHENVADAPLFCVEVRPADFLADKTG